MKKFTLISGLVGVCLCIATSVKAAPSWSPWEILWAAGTYYNSDPGIGARFENETGADEKQDLHFELRNTTKKETLSFVYELKVCDKCGLYDSGRTVSDDLTLKPGEKFSEKVNTRQIKSLSIKNREVKRKSADEKPSKDGNGDAKAGDKPSKDGNSNAKAGHWTTRECRVNSTGSDWLFVHTDVSAILTNGNGEFSAKPSHITVKNYGDMPCYFNSTGVNAPNIEVKPNEKTTVALAIYTRQGEPITSFSTYFKFWEGPVPK